MRECITLLIGQAGLQIGDVCWDIYCLEHGIQPDGALIDSKNRNESELLDTLFNESSIGSHYVPRSIMIDTDPSVVASILNGRKKDLYSSRMAITGKEDAANNFSRGYYTLPSNIMEETLDTIRRSMELCDSFQGFLMFNSFGGGTGSGFTSKLLDELNQMYGTKNRVEFNVFPSLKLSTSNVEPYNAIFRAHHSLQYSNCMFLFDNEACFDICQRQLDIDKAHYYHINQLIAQVSSSLTASTRFGGPLNVDLAEFETNLVPYPRVHFPTASYSPVFNRHKSFASDVSLKALTKSCFRQENQMIKYNPSNGKYAACCLLYRGDCTTKEVNSAMANIKDGPDIRFVKWSPGGLKTGISSEPPSMNEDMADVKRACCMLANNTALHNNWQMLAKKFDLMFNKRAFVFWYVGEGMEEGEFIEARENIAYLIKDYEEMAETGSINEERYSLTKSSSMNGDYGGDMAPENSF